MRILWINHRDIMHPEAGGAETRIIEIASRLVDIGHRVDLLVEKVNGLPSESFINGIHVTRYGNRLGIHLKAPLYVKEHGEEYDIVIDDIAHAVPWYSPLVTRTPVVAHIHHVHQDVLDIELPRPLAAMVKLLEKSMVKVYKFFIVVSTSTLRELVNKIGVDKNRVILVPNGVDTKKYKPGEKSAYPLVLWVGRIKRYKRLSHVIKAFKIVKESIPHARLVIVGTGDYEYAIRALVEKLGLRDVILTGRIPDDEKIKWMQRAWVIVSTSTKEGWGMTITEAAACRTPAVAYNVPGLRDSIRDGVTGILVEPGDIYGLARAIVTVLRNDRLREELSENAYRYAQRLDWRRIARMFSRALEYIVSSYGK